MTEAFEQGQVIAGRYRVLRRLGVGGMADVYLAEDTTLGRQVAVKVLLKRYAGDASFVERFRREAQAAARINHPNIVNIYDWGPVDGTYYIVMEYVEGETLKDHIRREGRYNPSEAVRIALELLAGVQVAHGAHIVHRDIKSQNILIDRAGTVKVTDFGIAKADDSQMTEAGSILGTAQYLAPEQAKGESVDERTDLYSVGVVFYEMLTGSLPFRGDSAVTVALKHVNEQPAEPAELVPGLPYSLNQICLKALAKDPDQRYRTAAEFSADLVAARSGGPLLAAAYDPSLDRTLVQSPSAGNEGTTRVLPRAPVAAAAGGAAAGTAGAAGANGGRDKKRKRSPWPWIALVAFLVIAAVAGVLIWHSFFGGSTLTVPSVVGQAQAAATTQLRSEGFAVTTHVSYSDLYGVGLVTRQQPGADSKLAKGGTVDIWVSHGPASVALIDLTGWTPAAVAELASQERPGRQGALGHLGVDRQGQGLQAEPGAGDHGQPRRHRHLLCQSRPAAGDRARPVGPRPGPGHGGAAGGRSGGRLLAGDEHLGAGRRGRKPEPGGQHGGPQGQHRGRRDQHRHTDADDFSVELADLDGHAGRRAQRGDHARAPGRAAPEQRRLRRVGQARHEHTGLGLRLRPVARGRRQGGARQHRHHLGHQVAPPAATAQGRVGVGRRRRVARAGAPAAGAARHQALAMKIT